MAFEIGERVTSTFTGPGTIIGPLERDEDRTPLQRIHFDNPILGERLRPIKGISHLEQEPPFVTKTVRVFSASREGLSETQQDVLDWFNTQPSGRGTDEQLEVALKSKYPAQTTVSKRRTDLVHKGLLRPVIVNGRALKEPNIGGVNVTVWEVVPEYRVSTIQKAGGDVKEN